MDIVYLKLQNGDELFAHRISEEGNLILLDNVMVMETVQVEADTKYLFMSRYTQYCDIHSISLDRSQVVFIGEVSETVQKHYLTSVRYAEQLSDARFQKGISEADRHLSALIKDRKNDIPVSYTKH